MTQVFILEPPIGNFIPLLVNGVKHELLVDLLWSRIALVSAIHDKWKFGGFTGPFMLMIANLFGVLLSTSTHNTPPRTYWYINVTANSGIQAVIAYFSVYPLMGVKHLDYLNFKAAFDLIDQGLHLTPEGQSTIRDLKGSMNKARTTFTWDHLSNFYT